jgi:hypothetical protein
MEVSEECSATILRVEVRVCRVRNGLNYIGSKGGVVWANDHENDSFEDCSGVFRVKAEMKLRER